MKYKVTPTIKQKKAADIMIKQKLSGENINKRKALLEAGFSDYVSKTPKIVIESRGFQELINNELDDVTLVNYLKTDLELKEGNRLGELKLAFDLKGHTTNKADITVHQETSEQLAKMSQIIDEASKHE